MTRIPNLEPQVRHLLNCLYNCEFIGRLEVLHNDKIEDRDGNTLSPEEYTLHLYIQNDRFAPMSISKQCESEEEFLCFLEKEFMKRNLIRSDYYKIKLDGSN